MRKFVLVMKSEKDILSVSSCKGAAIFKRMLEDKKAVSEHLRKGGDITQEIAKKYNIVKLSTISKNW